MGSTLGDTIKKTDGRKTKIVVLTGIEAFCII